MNTINIENAKCSQLSLGATVNLLKSEAGEAGTKLSGFELVAYTGAVVERWWGKLAISIEGISAKQQMPIFRNHSRGEIVGYSTSTSKDQAFKVHGVFSQYTEAAKEVMALAGEGFPWQASIGVAPKVIMEVREGASMLVNGVMVTGPGEVWVESEVFETSFVPLGADGATSATAFSDVKEVAMPVAGGQSQRPISAATTKEKNMDLQEFKTQHPELVTALRREFFAGISLETLSSEHSGLVASIMEKGGEAERLRIADVRGQLIPGHEKVIEAMAADGKSTGADAAKAIVAAEKALRAGAGEALENQANKTVPPAEGTAGGKKQMKRSAWSQLDAIAQHKFVAEGGVVID